MWLRLKAQQKAHDSLQTIDLMYHMKVQLSLATKDLCFLNIGYILSETYILMLPLPWRLFCLVFPWLACLLPKLLFPIIISFPINISHSILFIIKMPVLYQIFFCNPYHINFNIFILYDFFGFLIYASWRHWNILVLLY